MPSSIQDYKNDCLKYTDELFNRFNYVYDRPVGLVPGQEFYGIHRSYWDENQYKGSLYDHRGRLVQSTLRFNSGDLVPADPEVLNHALSFDGISDLSVYGGSLFPILGHFLVETLGRLWPLLQYKNVEKIYFHHWPGLDIEKFRSNSMYTHIFEAFGVDINAIRIIDKEIKFTNMILPEPMSIYHSYMHPGMNMLYDKIIGSGLKSDSKRRLFLSRSQWTENRRIANEDILDRIFEQLGYDVIYPEQLQAAELIELIGSAQDIAATDGSHAHLVAFASPGTRFVSLDTRIIPTQVALAALRGVKAYHIPLHRGAFFDIPSKTLTDPDLLLEMIGSIAEPDYTSSLLNGAKAGNRLDEAWSLYRIL